MRPGGTVAGFCGSVAPRPAYAAARTETPLPPPLIISLATLDFGPDNPAACLLHADVHIMGPDCWTATRDWSHAHDHLESQEAHDDYQAAVERKMLDQLVQSVGGIITA